MEEEAVKAAIEKGGYLCRVIVEILGAPAKHVEETIEKVVKLTKENNNITIIKAKVFDPKEEEDNLFSSFAELELLFKDINELMGYCFDFMPSSVEIVEPQKTSLNNDDLSSWVNELQSRLHAIDKRMKETNAMYKLTETNLHTIIRYNILRAAKEPKTKEELLMHVGIDEKGMDAFLEKLIERKEITQNGETYKTGEHVTFKQ